MPFSSSKQSAAFYGAPTAASAPCGAQWELRPSHSRNLKLSGVTRQIGMIQRDHFILQEEQNNFFKEFS